MDCGPPSPAGGGRSVTLGNRTAATAQNGGPAIACQGLAKDYGETVALRSTNLVIDRGQRVAVFGRNGAGKTTLIKAFAGLLRPSAGTVRVFGAQPWSSSGAARAHVGLITHQSFLYEELNARENLRFYAALYGVQDAPARIETVLSTFGLSHRARQPVRTLSRGLQQRVALARAMVHNPPVLLLDEPDTGLDPLARQSLEDVIEDAGSRLTVITATHDVDWGLRLADRSIVLEAGGIAHDSGDRPPDHEAVMRVLLNGGTRVS